MSCQCSATHLLNLAHFCKLAPKFPQVHSELQGPILHPATQHKQITYAFRFSMLRFFKLYPSRLWYRVVLQSNINVSEVNFVSIFSVKMLLILLRVFSLACTQSLQSVCTTEPIPEPAQPWRWWYHIPSPTKLYGITTQNTAIWTDNLHYYMLSSAWAMARPLWEPHETHKYTVYA
jgi:hypothetical protein